MSCLNNRVISKKETLLYESVIYLLQQGENISEIRVADIAKEAGIGKGTVYEYVSSKEELIANAFLFQMEREIKRLYEKAVTCLTFHEQCHAVFDLIDANARSGVNMMNVITSGDVSQTLMTTMQSMKKDFCNASNQLLLMLDDIIAQGVEEGILKECNNLEYQHFVITAVCSALISRQCSGVALDRKSEEKMAYQMLIQSFR